MHIHMHKWTPWLSWHSCLWVNLYQCAVPRKPCRPLYVRIYVHNTVFNLFSCPVLLPPLSPWTVFFMCVFMNSICVCFLGTMIYCTTLCSIGEYKQEKIPIRVGLRVNFENLKKSTKKLTFIGLCSYPPLSTLPSQGKGPKNVWFSKEFLIT